MTSKSDLYYGRIFLRVMFAIVIGVGAIIADHVCDTQNAVAASQQEFVRASNLIQGTWQARDGGKLTITPRDFGKASYQLRDASDDGTYFVVTIAVNGGRSIDTLTFTNGNNDYMMLNNLITGYSQDYTRL